MAGSAAATALRTVDSCQHRGCDTHTQLEAAGNASEQNRRGQDCTLSSIERLDEYSQYIEQFKVAKTYVFESTQRLTYKLKVVRTIQFQWMRQSSAV